MSIRSSLSRLFRFLWSGVDGLRKILHLMVLLFIFSIIVSALASSSVVIPQSGALVIQPAGNIVEQLAGDPFDRALQELMGDGPPQTLMKDIVDGLEFAKDDERISAVVLDLSAMPGGGLSKLKRISSAIEDFKQSGKPVIATADYYGQGSYYLAAHADTVYMHPDGALVLSGFGSYRNFYKTAIDKLKIDWNIFRVGTYKSAVEPFMRDDMSVESEAALLAVLDQLWVQYMSDVEAARSLDSGVIQDVLENLIAHVEATNGDLAQLALEQGFVDGLVTRAELQQLIIDVAGKTEDDDSYTGTALGDYLPQMRMLQGDTVEEKNVAVIVAAGEILNGSQAPGLIGGDSTANLLKQARNDDAVSAVVFRVDSPGGSAFASELILNEVQALQEAGKPVVVSMSSLAASGGYWVSMAADSIFATPYTITGSIGIFGMFPTIERSLDTIGVSTDGIGTTPWAGELRPDREMSADTRTLFQMFINEGYDDFISGVAMHRGMEKEVVDSIAQGRIWTGSDALKNGLIDGIGDIDEAIVEAAQLADLESDSYGIKYFAQELGPGEQLALDLMSGAGKLGLDVGVFSRKRSSLERLADVVEAKLSPLVRFNDPKGIYAHCMCDFQ
ncbi:MAG: signal peptide peptidase SppA [Woeseiaceae bacterium]|jgi:protease-4|nr:signal peptide peptidase SppA [Woeseiaceae bacterium]